MEMSVAHVAARQLGARQRVVKRTVCCTEAAHVRTVKAAYALYFSVRPPARSSICVCAWHGPFDVEIGYSAIGTAALPRSRARTMIETRQRSKPVCDAAMGRA